MLCDACARSLRRLEPPLCARCGTATIHPVERCRECDGRRLAFASARSAVVYAGAARRLVAAWKERGLRRAAPVAADLVAEVLEAPAADVITYIPPHPDRLLRRGHHPAERLARELAVRWGIPPAGLLVRHGGETRQANLSRVQRARNVRGAFVAVAEPPPRVVLVDDVYTTGATAAAAARALALAGAARIEVVTFARTRRGQ